jgi:hypothetical protein
LLAACATRSPATGGFADRAMTSNRFSHSTAVCLQANGLRSLSPGQGVLAAALGKKRKKEFAG